MSEEVAAFYRHLLGTDKRERNAEFVQSLHEEQTSGLRPIELTRPPLPAEPPSEPTPPEFEPSVFSKVPLDG
jgi:hypothetical protein